MADNTLLFVGGLHRSGTTPVAKLLALHPEVSGLTATGVSEDEGQHLQDVYPAAHTFGGAGRFAFEAAAHLTDTSVLVTPENAQRLWAAWSPFWDCSRRVLVEKSPPNLIMTRFLQGLYPDARFLVVTRHPAIVALSTSKWRRGTSLRKLLQHWVVAHELFVSDARHLRHVSVLKYEHLITRPTPTLAAVAQFLELEDTFSAESLQGHRSDRYTEQWVAMTGRGSRERRMFASLCREFEARIQRLGYSLTDLGGGEPFRFPPP